MPGTARIEPAELNVWATLYPWDDPTPACERLATGRYDRCLDVLEHHERGNASRSAVLQAIQKRREASSDETEVIDPLDELRAAVKKAGRYAKMWATKLQKATAGRDTTVAALATAAEALAKALEAKSKAHLAVSDAAPEALEGLTAAANAATNAHEAAVLEKRQAEVAANKAAKKLETAKQKSAEADAALKAAGAELDAAEQSGQG